MKTKTTLCGILAAAALAGCATTGKPEKAYLYKPTEVVQTEEGTTRIYTEFCASPLHFPNLSESEIDRTNLGVVNAALTNEKHSPLRYVETGKREYELYTTGPNRDAWGNKMGYRCATASVPIKIIKGM